MTGRMLLGLLLIISLYAFSSCFRQDIRPQRVEEEYALLVPRTDSVWYQNTIQGFLDACKEFGVKGTVLNSQLDENLVILNLEQALQQKVSGIALVSPNFYSGWSIMSHAFNSNIPIVSLDEKIADSQGRQLAPYIGLDNQKAGIEAGNWAIQTLKEEGWLSNPEVSFGIAVLTYQELRGMQDRTNAFLNRIETGFPAIPQSQIFPISCRKGSSVSGLLAMQQLVANHPGINFWFVFGATADSVIGAVRALEQVDLGQNAVAIGIDAGLGFIEFEKNRITPFKTVLFVDTYRQGYAAASAL
ncbi:MAG: substrate-binding domain-containing protein [Spirochaetales bacterium]|nr:substrate-binding domain-containing protein [Spirochaetales bacterium]